MVVGLAYDGSMIPVALWSLTAVTSPGLLAEVSPATAVVRADGRADGRVDGRADGHVDGRANGGAELRAAVHTADGERPQRRSRHDTDAAPRVQMGMGPTALAMLALVAAVIGRSVRRRRAASTPAP